MVKQRLYIHVGAATHFLSWELPEFAKYFELVDSPSINVPLLSFGPDVLEEASTLPAYKRFAVLFPGFSHNPLYNLELRTVHYRLIREFDKVFINPGPLEIAYKELSNIEFYPFSIDIKLVSFKNYRKKIASLIHVSNDGLQKDWQRSEAVMRLTGLPYEVFPPREDTYYKRQLQKNNAKNLVRKSLLMPQKKYLPYGYVNHKLVVKKYQKYDGFVHIARDIQHPILVDGKYTASLIEAGVTGSILFWHDTLNLGNSLETVFSLPLDTESAAKDILEIKDNIDVLKHSRLTREEMLDTFNAEKSVAIRAEKILAALD